MTLSSSSETKEDTEQSESTETGDVKPSRSANDGDDEDDQVDPFELFPPHDTIDSNPSHRRFRRRRPDNHQDYVSIESMKITCCGLVLVVFGVIMLVFGAVMVSEAEGDRLHGWHHRNCTIVRNYAKENVTKFTNVCVYFSVHVQKHHHHPELTVNGTTIEAEPICAVPASIAGRGGLTDPPACAGLPTLDMLDIDYWRIVEDTKSVDCLVPMQGSIPADRCVATATTGGPGPGLWRAWLDRFVYLVRDPREAVAALGVATRIQRNTGIGLVIAGIIITILGLIITLRRLWQRMCSSCYHTNLGLRNNMSERYAQQHKMY